MVSEESKPDMSTLLMHFGKLQNFYSDRIETHTWKCIKYQVGNIYNMKIMAPDHGHFYQLSIKH